MIAAKALVFVLCLAAAVALANLLLSLGPRHWGVDFLILASTIIFALLLYFTLGLAVLRLVLPDYQSRLRLGQSGHSFETPLLAITSNLLLHAAALYTYGQDLLSIILVIASAVFFAYPFYYLVNLLWGFQPEVLAITMDKKRLRTPFFTNDVRTVQNKSEYLPLTISLPVYTESNAVIFNTIKSCQRAIEQYQATSGQVANLLVSDDGLAYLIDGELNAQSIAEASGQAGERIDFYRRNGVAFVARPRQGRVGKFKKSSNLNFTYELAHFLSRGVALDALLAPDSRCFGAYAQGDIVVHDIILLLDKDSDLHPRVLAATVPEFSADPSLAFTQNATRAQNENVNYFTRMSARFTDLVYKITLPNKALQGLQVHLMGHNAFLRKAFLEQTQGWDEKRVSEDYAKALSAYSKGWHGLYVAYPGLEFGEQMCQSFTEESSKQLRYSYGINEIIPDLKLKLPSAMKVDLSLYYLSFLNLIAALPMILLLLALHQIYYLCAGIIVNIIIFLLFPIVQGWVLGKAVNFRNIFDPVRYYLLNALAYIGYSSSILRGFAVFIKDRASGNYEPFGATNVDEIEHNFITGVQLLWNYARHNKIALLIFLCILFGCAQVMGDIPPHIIRPLITLFLLIHIFAPVVLTPQLFANKRSRARQAQRQALKSSAPASKKQNSKAN
jgi:cellulose synthase/poly-beta-1,6-N-acetylglucosamine synthase-like glycosyltransferase